MRWLMVFCCILFFPVCTICEERDTSGSYRFGPDVSRKEGCHEAKKIAKANALEEYSTEFMLSDREIRCDEEDLDTSCKFTKSLYSQYTSEVFSFDKDLEEIEDFGSYQVCTVFGRVWIDQKRNNPNFYFSVNLNQSTFYDEELLHFEFLTNSKMCISIFHAESTNKRIQIQKIFPNISSKTRSGCFKKGKFLIPSNNARSKWVFRVRKNPKNKVSEENFLIVGSEQKVRWLNEYHSNGEFFRQLSSIPNESRYFVSLPLIVKNKD